MSLYPTAFTFIFVFIYSHCDYISIQPGFILTMHPFVVPLTIQVEGTVDCQSGAPNLYIA